MKKMIFSIFLNKMSWKKVDHIRLSGYHVGVLDGVLTIWIGCVVRAQSLPTKLVDTPGTYACFKKIAACERSEPRISERAHCPPGTL